MPTRTAPLVMRLLQRLAASKAPLGHYDPKTQTWSHRDAEVMSPRKHNREH